MKQENTKQNEQRLQEQTHERKNEDGQMDKNIDVNDSIATIGKDESISQSANTPDLGLSSALGLFSLEVHGEDLEELKRQKK